LNCTVGGRFRRSARTPQFSHSTVPPAARQAGSKAAMPAMGLRMGLTLMPFCPNQPLGWQKSFCMSTTTSTLRTMSSVMR
jgi:hypothetical protein